MTARPPRRTAASIGPDVARRAGAALAAVLVLMLGTVVPAAAQEDPGPTEPPATDGTLALVTGAAVVLPGQPLRVTVDVDDATPDTVVVIDVLERVTDRGDLAAVLDGADRPAVFTSLPLPTQLLDIGPQGELVVRLGTAASPDDPTAASVPVLDEAGVWPLRIRLLGPDGVVLAAVTTPVLRAEPDDPGVAVAVVADVAAPTALQPDDTIVLTDDAIADAAADLDAVADLPDLPWTVLARPETIDALGEIDRPAAADLLDRLRQLGDRASFPAQPYVDPPLGAIADSGLGAILDSLDVQGRATLTALLGRAPDPPAWPAGPGEDAGLALLGDVGRELGARHPVDVVVTGPSPGTPIRRSPSGVVVVAPRTDLTVLTTAGDDRPDAVQIGAATLVLAAGHDGAATAFAAPATVDETTIEVLELVADWPGSLRFVPLAEAAGLADAGAGLPPGGGADLSDIADRIPGLTAALFGSLDMLRPDEPQVLDVSRHLAVAFAADRAPAERRADLDVVQAFVDRVDGAISLGGDTTVNLTSRTGTVPVLLRNDAGVPIRVRVDVRADRLDFPEGTTFDVEVAGDQHRLDIPVEARATGSVPVFVTVTSPDGDRLLAEAQLNLRSTAIPGVGIALSVGALTVLGVWWFRHWRRERHAAAGAPPME